MRLAWFIQYENQILLYTGRFCGYREYLIYPVYLVLRMVLLRIIIILRNKYKAERHRFVFCKKLIQRSNSKPGANNQIFGIYAHNILTEQMFCKMGHATTKPDKVNILLCDINESLMWLKD